MSTDHINIQHPDRYDVFGESYQARLKIERLEGELKQLGIYRDLIANNLTAIFTRIERGDPAELHYPDGRVFVITGKEKT